MDYRLAEMLSGQGPWALLAGALVIYTLRASDKREKRLVDVIDRLGEKYDLIAKDVHEIKHSIGQRLGG